MPLITISFFFSIRSAKIKKRPQARPTTSKSYPRRQLPASPRIHQVIPVTHGLTSSPIASPRTHPSPGTTPAFTPPTHADLTSHPAISPHPRRSPPRQPPCIRAPSYLPNKPPIHYN